MEIETNGSSIEIMEMIFFPDHDGRQQTCNVAENEIQCQEKAVIMAFLHNSSYQVWDGWIKNGFLITFGSTGVARAIETVIVQINASVPVKNEFEDQNKRFFIALLVFLVLSGFWRIKRNQSFSKEYLCTKEGFSVKKNPDEIFGFCILGETWVAASTNFVYFFVLFGFRSIWGSLSQKF